MAEKQLIRIEWPDGAAIVLGDDPQEWVWIAANDEPKERDLARRANDLSWGCQYSTAHGQPGFFLATTVAEKLQGKAILPPMPPAPEGVVY